MDISGHTHDAVAAWLAEDVGSGDLTTGSLIDPELEANGHLVLKSPGVVCGLEAAADVYQCLEVTVTPLTRDGARVRPGPIATVSGSARGILSGERLALNLVSRLSGVATLTREYVDRVAGTNVEIRDTRKTTPGLRRLEKYAVRCGGGTNHRQGLFDRVLIKDNHLRLTVSVADAIERARATGAHVQVECDTLEQVEEAIAAGADEILLDNMPAATIRNAVALVARRVPVEASGRINLYNVRAIADTGVDSISVGSLTHSAPAIDASLELR